MSLIELDVTVTFGSGAAATNNTVVSPSVSSTGLVGSVGIANSGAFGTLIFATDRLAGVKAAVAANTAPQAAAYSALGTLSGVYASQGHGYTSLVSYYTNQTIQGSAHIFACPGETYDSTHALAIQGFTNGDMTGAFTTALYGFLSNTNVPVCQSIIRNWMNFTTISQLPNPGGDPANDAPLMAGTTLNALLIAACILDEGLHGNWPAMSGWTAADRTNFEQWIINTYYPALQVIINPFTSGAPASGMENNWRSWAIYGSALSGYYLQSSLNPATAATGSGYLNATIAALNNAIAGQVQEAHPLTSPPTPPLTNAIVTSAFSYTGVSPAVPMNVGDIFLENLRGASAIHYNYYSLLPMLAAAQVIAAAFQTNILSGQRTLLTSALTEELSRLNSGGNTDTPYIYEMYEAMGAVYQSATYTAYASPHRPVMPADSGSVFQHTTIYQAATLTSLINGYSGGGAFNYPNLPGGLTLRSFRSGLVALPGSETPGAWGQALNQSYPTNVNNLTEVTDATVPWGGPNVTATLYTAGLPGGQTPCAGFCTAMGGHGSKQGYMAFALKFQSGFQFIVDAINKIFYLKPTQGANIYIAAIDNGNGTYQPQFRTQAPLTGPFQPINFTPGVWNGTTLVTPLTYSVPIGSWCIWEVRCTLNSTASSTDGSADMWITQNGVTTHTHTITNCQFSNLNDTWSEWDYQPYYGGGGSNVPSNQFLYLGPVGMFD